MRENRPYGSEGGEGLSFPTPYQLRFFASILGRRCGTAYVAPAAIARIRAAAASVAVTMP
jgi:hypothetical protein